MNKDHTTTEAPQSTLAQYISDIEAFENQLPETYQYVLRDSFRNLQKKVNRNQLPPPKQKVLSDRLSKLRQKLNQMADKADQQNHTRLSPILDEVIELAKSGPRFKEIWNKLNDLQNQIKNSFLNQEHYGIYKEMLQISFNRLKKRQNEYYETLKKNQVKNITVLKDEVDQCLEIAQKGDHFKKIRQQLIKTQKRVNTLELVHADRTTLREILQQAFESVKEREDIYFDEKKVEWAENYKKTLKVINDAYEIARTETFFKKGWEVLLNGQQTLKETSLKHDDHQKLWEKLQEAFDHLKNRQQQWKEEIAVERVEGFGRLDRLMNRAINEAETHKDLPVLFERLKEWHREVLKARYLEQDQKKHLLDKMDEAFALFKERQKEDQAKRKLIWQEKQRHFITSMTEKQNYLREKMLPEEDDRLENLQNRDPEKHQYFNEDISDQKEIIADLEQKIAELTDVIARAEQQLNKS